MRWNTLTIDTDAGKREAIAPEIISASRSTDIPAFHAAWFMRRLEAGYVRWVNPFNQQPVYVSFARTRAIVFWSKNPAPLLPYLSQLDARGIPYYFQFTVNDYAAERLEPNVPSLESRIRTFRELAARIGTHRVIWRLDPLILAAGLAPADLLAKLTAVGERLHEHTEKLIFSFADISSYARVPKNLAAAGIPYRDFTPEEMVMLGQQIGQRCRQWGITPVTCGEEIDLSAAGVEKNQCIDDALLLAISHNDPALVELFGYSLAPQLDLFDQPEPPTRKPVKDPGQRKACGCAFSKDIGQYNTCPHLCVYCYANTSPATVQRNMAQCGADAESIVAR